MARLTKQARSAIPTSEFAGPNRSFPIEDAKHAKAAIMLSGNAPNPAAIVRKARAKLASLHGHGGEKKRSRGKAAGW